MICNFTNKALLYKSIKYANVREVGFKAAGTHRGLERMVFLNSDRA